MFNSIQKAEKEKKSKEALTPEEKLFRVITSVDQADAEVEDLIEKYTSAPPEKEDSDAPAQKLKTRWRLDAFRISPLSLIILTVCGIIFGLVMIVSQMKPENNFYFYGNNAESSSSKNQETSAAHPAAGVTVPIQEEAAYKLVGISTEGNAKVAMIEVTADQRARFVKEGDFLPGGALVQKIDDYSVHLSSGSRHWDLT